MDFSDSKIPKNDRKICFPNMSKIHFPGLRTLRLAIWTMYFRVFPTCLCNFSDFFWDNCWVDFMENLSILPLKAAILAYFVKLILSGLVDFKIRRDNSQTIGRQGPYHPTTHPVGNVHPPTMFRNFHFLLRVSNFLTF